MYKNIFYFKSPWRWSQIYPHFHILQQLGEEVVEEVGEVGEDSKEDEALRRVLLCI